MKNKQLDLFDLWKKTNDKDRQSQSPTCDPPSTFESRSQSSSTFESRSQSSSTFESRSEASSASESQSQSSSTFEYQSIPLCILQEPVVHIEIDSDDSPSSSSISNALKDHHYGQSSSTSLDAAICNSNKPHSTNTSKSKPKRISTPTPVRTYLSSWETLPESKYKTYIRDPCDKLQQELLPWLYFRDDAMRCSLCEKHMKRRNTNGW